MQYVSSVFSTSWWTDRVALYGSTTVSDTLGDGTTEYVFIIRSGYSSLILEISKVPIPDPVPPPSEWVSWKPWRQSQDSDSLRTTSNTESTNSAPETNKQNCKNMLWAVNLKSSSLQCNGPWPNYSLLQIGQRQSYQVGKSDQKVQPSQNPLFQVPDPKVWHEEHTFLHLPITNQIWNILLILKSLQILLLPDCSKPQSAQAVAQRFQHSYRLVQSHVHRILFPKTAKNLMYHSSFLNNVSKVNYYILEEFKKEEFDILCFNEDLVDW